MPPEETTIQERPIYISRSKITTEVNKTGTWRFVRPEYDEKSAPCGVTCPAGENIPRIEMLAGRGLFKTAWETILQENPFPAICGRVCFHTCETVCNRKEMDQPIAIHHIERFIGDMAIRENFPVPGNICGKDIDENSRTPKKRVAIIGAGPAGLSAAWFLSMLGHKCEVFEAENEPGGVLRWGIPAYRLPTQVLKDEIARITDQGVSIYCGRDISMKFIESAKSRYDAIFMGCGYGRSYEMGIPGENLAVDGLAFLKSIRKEDPAGGKNFRAAIIGGGNTAIDVARSLVRTGAEAIIVYRRRREDMPAFEHEIEMAIEEGVKIVELAAPVTIENSDDGLTLKFHRMKVVESDSASGGRARVAPDGDLIESISVSKVFTAIGAEAAERWYLPSEECQETLSLSQCTLQNQEIPIIFGGDLSTPIKSVTDAIGSGKEAAMALDILFREGVDKIKPALESCRIGAGKSLSMERYMGGTTRASNPATVTFSEINVDYFTPAERRAPEVLSPDIRVKSFDEVERTLDIGEAADEIMRCFNCGICNDCDNCRLYCPELAINADSKDREINLDYCKGCGICVVECPRNAMSLKEENI